MEGRLQDSVVETLVLRYTLHQDKKDGIHHLDLVGVTIPMEMEGNGDCLKYNQENGEGDGVILLPCTCISWKRLIPRSLIS
jgi:hypothetical protein